MTAEIPKISTIGNNIRKVRKLRNLSQAELANLLGMSRQNLGKLEQADNIDEEKLNQIAQALGVSPEGIENFNDDQALFKIENMSGNAAIYQYNGSQSEKIEELYEALLKSEKDKNELLQQLLNSRKTEK